MHARSRSRLLQRVNLLTGVILLFPAALLAGPWPVMDDDCPAAVVNYQGTNLTPSVCPVYLMLGSRPTINVFPMDDNTIGANLAGLRKQCPRGCISSLTLLDHCFAHGPLPGPPSRNVEGSLYAGGPGYCFGQAWRGTAMTSTKWNQLCTGLCPGATINFLACNAGSISTLPGVVNGDVQLIAKAQNCANVDTVNGCDGPNSYDSAGVQDPGKCPLVVQATRNDPVNSPKLPMCGGNLITYSIDIQSRAVRVSAINGNGMGQVPAGAFPYTGNYFTCTMTIGQQGPCTAKCPNSAASPLDVGITGGQNGSCWSNYSDGKQAIKCTYMNNGVSYVDCVPGTAPGP